MRKIKNIAVFFGGNSYEREISVITGVFAVNLLKGRYNVIPVYISEDNCLYTSESMTELKTFKFIHLEKFKKLVLLKGGLYFADKKIKKYSDISCILNCCHGGFGESGGLYSLSNFYGIPITSSPTYVSEIFMDKYLTKLALEKVGVPVLDYVKIDKIEYTENAEEVKKSIENLGYPVVLKPAKLGSSIGINIAFDVKHIDEALKNCFTYDERVIAEKFLTDKIDVNCAAYFADGKIITSEAKSAYSKEGIFTFEEKYLSRPVESEPIEGEINEKIKDITRTLYSEFSLFGMVRADFLLSGGEIYFNEFNLVPGSLAFGMFTKKLSEQKNILSDIIEEAVLKGGGEKKVRLMTGILNNKEITCSSGCKIR